MNEQTYQRVEYGWRERIAGQAWWPVRCWHAIVQDARALSFQRYVVRNLVVSQLKVRYQRSVLGFAWTLLHPILMLGVLAMVFSQIMRWETKGYAVYLFAGMIPWQLFASSVENGSRTLVANESLIKKVSVQKLIFPLSEIIVAIVNAAFATIALLVLLLFLGAEAKIQLVLLPLIYVLFAMFTLGVVLVMMTLFTFYRDFDHIISVLLQALYFLSPILYPPEMVEKIGPLLNLNPLTHYLGLFHKAVYSGQWPGLNEWMICGGLSLVSLVVGYYIYKSQEHKYVFRL